MISKPILFSGDNVRAILEDRKTKTRRIMNQPIPDFVERVEVSPDHLMLHYHGNTVHWANRCPYGKPGDFLWVRETWATPGNYDHIKPSNLSVAYQADIVYRASEQYPIYYKWRPSIFMPRWASRITLKVVNVRVERLQDISHEDSMSEGCPDIEYGKYEFELKDVTPHSYAKMNFRRLWDSLNAKRGYGWNTNPMVWVVEFEVQS